MRLTTISVRLWPLAMRPFLAFASSVGMTRAYQLGSRGVEAMDRAKRQVQLDTQLNAEQSARMFAKVVQELVRLGEVECAQAQAAVALLTKLRSSNAHKEMSGCPNMVGLNG